MRFFLLLVPMVLLAGSREECARMLEHFASLEKAYDAVVQAGVAAPASETVIRRFRSEGENIYAVCQNKMSTTRWYMLGKKVRSDKVAQGDFHMQTPAELERYAISHPPVITEVRCGRIITK